ncbi:hypothetical protein PMAYCL1PPCAC_26874, partial [Pristionchus mayeri]
MIRHICAVLAFALVAEVVLGAPFEKKADLGEFASALNGAGRLRYGKRSSGGFPYIDFRDRLEQGAYADTEPFSFEKRAPSPADFVANLNKAERLR